MDYAVKEFVTVLFFWLTLLVSYCVPRNTQTLFVVEKSNIIIEKNIANFTFPKILLTFNVISEKLTL